MADSFKKGIKKANEVAATKKKTAGFAKGIDVITAGLKSAGLVRDEKTGDWR